ncbi:MAG: hypothetical protein IPJ19_14380 [Planctomycetes bacterium]|nr:hypothetical protein [Planctomycetota bacterium]
MRLRTASSPQSHAAVPEALARTPNPPTTPLATNCQPQWLSTFGGAPVVQGTIGALQVFDDGTGPALYVGGSFTNLGGVPVHGIARFDGTSFTSLGSGIEPSAYGDCVRALAVWDDGGGPALYAAGTFTSAGGVAAQNIAKWDGASWTALGAGLDLDAWSLCVFDDGSGPALFAGGSFQNAGGQPSHGIAKWDGSNWSPLGAGLGGFSGIASALAVYDDGAGPALYVGGQFDTAGGTQIHDLARWDGANWSALANAPNGYVQSFAVFDDGGGARLYMGGLLFSGAQPDQHVMSWDGSSFRALGSGTNAVVDGLQVFDDGTGAALFAGGAFTVAGGHVVKGIARWDGVQWSALAAGTSGLAPNHIERLCVYDAGSGPALFGAGEFTQGGGSPANSLSRWDASGWERLTDGVDRPVDALLVHDDGSGPALYAGGDFGSAHGAQLQHLARWNGGAWTALGGGVDGRVYALASFDDGGGPALYAGGAFTHAGGVPAQHVARWRAGSWSAVGIGMDSRVSALAAFDDGGGPVLYAAGYFTHADESPAGRIARWNGANWIPVGSGMNGSVLALVVHAAGSGPRLYAGGGFTNAGGSGATHLAQWDGLAWSPVPGVVNGEVRALAVHDDGSGPDLYVGGSFTLAGGVSSAAIASWDGNAWSALGNGLGGVPGLVAVDALAVHDAAGARVLVAGGSFDTAGGAAAKSIARWDGSQWSALGGGVEGAVSALASLDEGGGPTLFAGGAFAVCADSADSYFTRWASPAGCGYSGASVCEPGVAGVSACPCSNPPSGVGRGCDNSSASGGASLEASGQSSLAHDTLVCTSAGEKPSALSVLLQGDALNASGSTFGQGVRCVAGTRKRLYVKTAVGGSITAPGAGDASISARSAALGDSIAQGTHRYYGVYYRDPLVLGGCAATSTFNLTQQLSVLWQP